jgi:AmmeMemoRadiSam system protein A
MQAREIERDSNPEAKRMKMKICAWLIPLAVQLAFLTSAGSGDKPFTIPKGIPLTALDRERVKEEDMTDIERLTEEQGKYLLREARKTIQQALSGEESQRRDDAHLSPVFNQRRGTFVTLTIGGNLRGCIGHIIPQESLIEGIRINAINAAFKDPRFRPLGKDEWKKVKIEISILTDPKPLSYSDADDLLRKLRPGIDGVIIKKGYRQSTFLPQVWDQLPRKEEFLNHLCLKAGLDGNEWKRGGLEVSTYQVQAFEE